MGLAARTFSHEYYARLEQERALAKRDTKSRTILHPEDPKKLRWDAFVCLLVLWQAWALPVHVAFKGARGESPGWVAFDVVIDCVFIADLALCFRTAYVTISGELVVAPPRIALHYVRSNWIWVDLPASIPFDWFAFGAASRGSLLSILKCARLLRIGRLVKMIHLSFKFTGAWRIIRLFIWFALCAHWTGCIFYLVCEYEIETGAGGTTWSEAEGLNHAAVGDAWQLPYCRALYLGLLILIGEDTAPRTQVELVITSVAMLLGACMYATLFGQMSLLIANFNRSAIRYQHTLDELQPVAVPRNT